MPTTPVAALFATSPAADNGVQAADLADSTAAGRAFLTAADAAAQKLLLGLPDAVTDATHGNRGGGPLHALATQTVAGFQSAADKTKLDSLPDAATLAAALTAKVDDTQISAFALTLLDDPDAATAKGTIGLGNVNNTSDADKPVSTAQQTALNGKQTSIAIQDEGVALGTPGTVDTINFTGSAVAATRTGNVVTITVSDHVPTRTVLKAIDTTTRTYAYLTENGRAGPFKFMAGDYSALITADAAEGKYIKADAIAATAGAWVRIHDGPLNIMWFGAVADGTAAGGTADALAFASALNVMRVQFPSAVAYNQSGGRLYVPRPRTAGGYYRINSGKVDLNDICNLTIEGDGASRWGGFFYPNSTIVQHGTASPFFETNYANESAAGKPGTESLTLRDVGIQYHPSSGFTGNLLNVRGLGFKAQDCRFGSLEFSTVTTSTANACIVVQQHSYHIDGCSFSGAKRGVSLPLPSGTDGPANSPKITNNQFYDLEHAGIESAGSVSGGSITGNVFNPLYRRTAGQFQKYGIVGTFSGTNISGNSFLPTDNSITGFAIAAVSLVGGSGTFTGNVISNWLGTGVETTGSWFVEGNDISAAIPIMWKFGALRLGQNALATSVNTAGGASYGSDRNRAYAVGECLKPASTGNLVFRCKVAGTTGAAAPSWPSSDAAIGTTVADGTATFDVLPLASVHIATLGIVAAFNGSIDQQNIINGTHPAGWSIYTAAGGPAEQYGIDVRYNSITDTSVNGPKFSGYATVTAVQNALVHKTTSYTLTAKDVGRTFSNAAAPGSITFTLPNADRSFSATFLTWTPQPIVMQCQSGQYIFRTGTGGGSSTATMPSDQGSRVSLRGLNTILWEVTSREGTLT